MTDVIEQPKKIRLKCIKIHNKLRVRIISPGYYNNANCQFPRDLRVEGRLYDVDPSAINLVTRTTNYYSITKKLAITIISDIDSITDDFKNSNITVFEDNSEEDCAICMVNEKCIIIIPCGHYYTCAECTKKINKCPICRRGFTKTITKSEML
jgi:hypothetical protein